MISVIIPAFNCPRDLQVALASIRTQSYSDWECIVVDDGSAQPLVEAVGDHDPRIRWVRHTQNLGRGAARNTGLAHARGDFVAWQDADDWSYPERLAQQLEYLQDCPAVMAVGSAAAIVDARERLVGVRGARVLEPRLLGAHERPNVVHASLMLRRRVFDSFTYPSVLRYSEDFAFLSAALRVNLFANLSQALYCYREVQSQSVAKYWACTRTRILVAGQNARRYPVRAAARVAADTGKALIYTLAAVGGVRGLLYRRRQRRPHGRETEQHHLAWQVVRQECEMLRPASTLTIQQPVQRDSA